MEHLVRGPSDGICCGTWQEASRHFLFPQPVMSTELETPTSKCRHAGEHGQRHAKRKETRALRKQAKGGSYLVAF